MVALTATLLLRDLKILSTKYLSHPVFLRGSVDRPNIRLTVAKYNCKRRKLRKGETARGECWKSAASDLAKCIRTSFAIIYMDFTSEVKEMTESLSMEHELECRSFYSKNMKLEKKMKIMEEFSKQEFQVLCATESYKVGIHNPHVEFVARVGCMRNMSVLLQEFGRASHGEDRSSEGILLFNESKDDQRLAYWVKGCGEEDMARMKNNYAQCWQWIYCIYTGDCLREALLEYYSEGNYLVNHTF